MASSLLVLKVETILDGQWFLEDNVGLSMQTYWGKICQGKSEYSSKYFQNNFSYKEKYFMDGNLYLSDDNLTSPVSPLSKKPGGGQHEVGPADSKPYLTTCDWTLSILHSGLDLQPLTESHTVNVGTRSIPCSSLSELFPQFCVHFPFIMSKAHQSRLTLYCTF